MIKFTILGEPASKANSRKIVTFGDRPSSIKSDKARAYEKSALLQIPAAARARLEGPVRIWLRIFYASERPDLDESIVLDVLQDRFKTVTQPGGDKVRVLMRAGVYRNDRQVREKHVYHAIDKANPRAEIIICPATAQQADLELGIEEPLPF